MHTETQLKDLLPEKTKLKEQTDELDQLMRAGKQDLMNRYELNQNDSFYQVPEETMDSVYDAISNSEQGT